MFAPTPVTLGHEIAGVISKVGDGVTGWHIGDRVGIALVGDSVSGVSRNGGYTHKAAARPDVLVRVPDALAFEQAAASDAGAAAHSTKEATISTWALVIRRVTLIGRRSDTTGG